MQVIRQGVADWENPIEGDPKTYDVVEECPKCGGALKIVLTRKGKSSVLPCACDCMRAAFKGRELDYREAKLERYRKDCFTAKHQRCMTFENSEHDLSTVLDYAKEFEQIGGQGFGLLLYGPKGSGKTYAACAVANYLLDRGKRVKVTSVARMYNDIMERFEGRQDRIDSLARFDLVVIDDFGAERGSDSVEEVAYQVVDVLYQAQRPMVVTTNLDKSQMGGRAGSRIVERCYPIEMAQPVRAMKAMEMHEAFVQ